QIYLTFASGIQTNLSFEDAMKLAILVQEIPTEKIQQRVIDPSMAIPTQASIRGVPANVLRPVPDFIRILRDEFFNSSGALRPLAQENNLTLMQVEQARIRVINHTYVPEFEKRVASYLTSQGMQVVEYDIPTSIAAHTTIIVYSEKLYTLRYLTETFGITSHYIIIRPAINESVDIEIQIGEDWINKLPAGY